MPLIPFSQTQWKPEIIANIDQDEVFTTVVLVGERWTGIGVAKRNPRDVFDAQLGYDVAFARALRELADVTERNAGIVP